MIAITEQFGLNPILLLAQVVNFLILLFILKKTLYKPLLKVLDERKKRIAQSLKDAEEIEKKLQQTEEDREKKLQVAANEAKKIIDEATVGATTVLADAHAKAASDIEALTEKARQQISLEKDAMQKQLRSEMVGIVTLSLEKILNKKLTKKDQDELIKQTIKEI